MAPANPELRKLVMEMNRSALAGCFRKEKNAQLTADGEIFPSSVLPAIAVNKNGKERVFPMRWGFSLCGRLLINARAETASQKPTFRESWNSHRCIIPVSWYFEWEHDEKKRPGQKYALRPAMHGLIRLAALYRMEEGVPAFVILTRPAVKQLAWMHDRMPVMLPPDAAKEWICPQTDPDNIVKKSITDIYWQHAG